MYGRSRNARRVCTALRGGGRGGARGLGELSSRFAAKQNPNEPRPPQESDGRRSIGPRGARERRARCCWRAARVAARAAAGARLLVRNRHDDESLPQQLGAHGVARGGGARRGRVGTRARVDAAQRAALHVVGQGRARSARQRRLLHNNVAARHWPSAGAGAGVAGSGARAKHARDSLGRERELERERERGRGRGPERRAGLGLRLRLRRSGGSASHALSRAVGVRPAAAGGRV